MWRFYESFKAALRFPDYRPQPLNFRSAGRWIKQFERRDQTLAAQFLDNVIYISEATARKILVAQNAALTKRLLNVGLTTKKLIYVSIHDAGSSSPVMLNLLRDCAGLERLGCKFVDGRDSFRLNRTMNEVGVGALIYVDDFIGTGNQFCEERDFASKSFVGTFSEFLLTVSICEEAIYNISKRGIEAFAGHVHSKAERPLHDNSAVFEKDEKERLQLVCRGVNNKFGLGYQRMATMVVLYRNAPNTVPSVLRGSLNQRPFFGLFPRWNDLPLRKLE
jgi:hypothetical protein